MGFAVRVRNRVRVSNRARVSNRVRVRSRIYIMGVKMIGFRHSRVVCCVYSRKEGP